MVRASQQQLADSVGSVREVVGRVLSRFQADGMVRLSPSGIQLLDPVRLELLAHSRSQGAENAGMRRGDDRIP